MRAGRARPCGRPAGRRRTPLRGDNRGDAPPRLPARRRRGVRSAGDPARDPGPTRGAGPAGGGAGPAPRRVGSGHPRCGAGGCGPRGRGAAAARDVRPAVAPAVLHDLRQLPGPRGGGAERPRRRPTPVRLPAAPPGRPARRPGEPRPDHGPSRTHARHAREAARPPRAGGRALHPGARRRGRLARSAVDGAGTRRAAPGPQLRRVGPPTSAPYDLAVVSNRPRRSWLQTQSRGKGERVMRVVTSAAAVVLAAGGLVAVPVAANATPSQGITVNFVSERTVGDTTYIFQQITLAPGGTTGWHWNTAVGRAVLL